MEYIALYLYIVGCLWGFRMSIQEARDSYLSKNESFSKHLLCVFWPVLIPIALIAAFFMDRKD